MMRAVGMATLAASYAVESEINTQARNQFGGTAGRGGMSPTPYDRTPGKLL